MNKEIEIKAHVFDSELVKQSLEALYGEGQSFLKNDEYYKYNLNGSEKTEQFVRLRSSDNVFYVTTKNKNMSGVLELNDEIEFCVNNADVFREYLRITGAEEWIKKIKSGWKYQNIKENHEIIIELCEVKTLGWFIEIEIIIEDPNENEIDEAEKLLYEILDEVNVGKENIENRYYSELLRYVKKDPPDSTNRTEKGG